MKLGIPVGLIFSFSLSVYGQDLEIKNLLDSAKSIWYIDFDRTNELVDQAERLVSARGSGGDIRDLIDLYDLRIQSCNAFSRFQLWRQYVKELQELLDANKKVIGLTEYRAFSLRNSLAQAQLHAEIGDNANALELFVRLQAEYKRLPKSKEVCDELHTITNYMAEIHRQNGEYEAAVNQFLASNSYNECSDTYSVLDYRNIALTYYEKGDFSRAGRYLKLAEDSLPRVLKENPAAAARIALSLYETEASYYERIGSHDSAMLSAEKAVPLLKLRSVDDSFKGRINLRLGELYIREKKFRMAQSRLDQAEYFFLNSQESQPIHLASTYLAQAELFGRVGKINNALKYCGKAFERLVLNFEPDADGNPELVGSFSRILMYKILKKKSELLEALSVEKDDAEILLSAAKTNRLALALLDSTANEISLDKDKVNLAERTYSAFEDGIRIRYALYKQTGNGQYIDDCFALVDKSKGMLLLENLRSVNRFGGINAEWLIREKEIKSELLLAEQVLYKQEKENSADLGRSREHYATLKRDYASLVGKIKTESPDYYRLRFDHSVVLPNDVQRQSLQNSEAMIEYFVGDSTLALVALSANKRHVEVKKIHSDFFEKINKFKKVLITSASVEQDTALTNLSSALYAMLVGDALKKLDTGITSLTIIPDGVLGYIPFEVLRAADNRGEYLGNEYSIRYAYSATYLNEQMQRKKTAAKYFFAGFVSSDGERMNNETLAALPGAKEEIASIAELLGSSYSIFNPALKEEFISHASDFSILHLAMHSLVNNENPMFSVLVFSTSTRDSANNRLLTALELYNMTLNSELAVLSACNTGFGTLRRGEGIMSFARAFAYAGVPSAVISLWQVPDKATSKIMVNFYKYLKSGEAKDVALQHAKMQFIKEYPQMSAPFYWAGFILTGNKEKMEFPSNRSWYWIIVGVLFAEFFLIAAKRRLMRPYNEKRGI